MNIKDQPLQAGETQVPIQTQAPGANIAHTPTPPDPATVGTPISTENATPQSAVSPELPTSATPTPGESTTHSAASTGLATHGSPIPTEEHQTTFRSHKSLIIGVILAAIVVVSGLSVFIGFNNSSSQYQGFLQKIEAETEKLNADKTSAEQNILGDGSGANSSTEIDANSGAALPELSEDTLSPVDLAPSSPDAEDEGVAR